MKLGRSENACFSEQVILLAKRHHTEVYLLATLHIARSGRCRSHERRGAHCFQAGGASRSARRRVSGRRRS